MMTKQRWVYFCIAFVAAILCTSCFENGKAGNATPITVVVPTSAPGSETGSQETSATAVPDQSVPSADIVLPLTRQIPPPEIQAQVQWFDGGATGVASVCEAVYCENARYNSLSNIQIIQRPQSEGVLYEGHSIVLCLKGLSPQEPFTLTLETPEGDLITESGEANADGGAKLCPYGLNPVHGTYQVHFVSGKNVLDTEFEMASPPLPRIWESDLPKPSQIFKLHYAGFEPQEVVTTVWYITEEHPDYIYQSEYFTSWQTTVDSTGYAEQSIYVPSNFGNQHFVLATQSKTGTREEWVNGDASYVFNLRATFVTELNVYNPSVDEEQSANQQFGEVVIDDLSGLLLLEGPSEGWHTAPYGYKESTHWTYCTDEGVSNWAKWIPSLLTGYHEVFAFIPEHKAGTNRAQYRIFHNGGEDITIVSQADYANEWVSLGKYWFVGDWQEYVYLDDNTGEPRSSNTTIAFDAVKFVYVP